MSTFLLISSNSTDTLVVKPEFEVRYEECGGLWLALNNAEVQVKGLAILNFHLINECSLKVELDR